MTSNLRTIVSGTLEWRGILIYISLERQRFVDHLQIESLDPTRAPLPITETGYLSRFVSRDTIAADANPAELVETWLDEAARTKQWANMEIGVRQYELL